MTTAQITNEEIRVALRSRDSAPAAGAWRTAAAPEGLAALPLRIVPSTLVKDDLSGLRRNGHIGVRASKLAELVPTLSPGARDRAKRLLAFNTPWVLLGVRRMSVHIGQPAHGGDAMAFTVDDDHVTVKIGRCTRTVTAADCDLPLVSDEHGPLTLHRGDHTIAAVPVSLRAR